MATATTFATHPPETHDSTPTTWLPLTTTYTGAGPECSTIFWQNGGFNLVAFDPGYSAARFSAAPTSCVAAPASIWWLQNFQSIKSILSIGPIVCPQQYSTATSISQNPGTTFVACCPSSYAYVSSFSRGQPGECISPFSQSQTVTFAKGSLFNFTLTSSVMSLGDAATAIPVNGYVFGDQITTNTFSTTGSGGPTGSLTNNSQPATVDGGGLTTGAKVGIGIGVSLGVLGFAALVAAFILIRRHRRMPAQQTEPYQAIYTPTPADYQDANRQAKYGQPSQPWKIQPQNEQHGHTMHELASTRDNN